MIAFLFIAAVIGAAVLYFTHFKKGSSGGRVNFYSVGKEAGFSVRDLEQLKKLAISNDIQEPASIFKSKSQFEIIIRGVIKSAKTSGEINDLPIQDFLSRLFDYLKKIEMDTIESKVRISDSRQISEGQILRILVPNTGVFKSEIVKNYGNYITISRPVSTKKQAAMQWQGLKISVYFWREDDAGYVFDTEVIDEVFSKGISSLKIEHNDSLFRTQKRKSMRLKYKKPAFLYLLNDIDNPHTLEKDAGLRCMLEDISDTGCAFRIYGQASTGLRLKVQFALAGVPICIPCTVRSVDYKEETNISLVRMEADRLPIAVRNHILCEVFNFMPEDDEELPFRMTEEEEADASNNEDSSPAEKFQDIFNG